MCTDPDERPTFPEIIQELGEYEDDPIVADGEAAADTNGDAAPTAQQ